MISDKEMTDMIADARTRREGFEALVRQYSEPLYWKIRHIVINHEDADDVLQNAFLKYGRVLIPFRASLLFPPGFIASPSTRPWIFCAISASQPCRVSTTIRKLPIN